MRKGGGSLKNRTELNSRLWTVLYIVLFVFCANSMPLIRNNGIFLIPVFLCFAAVNIFPGFTDPNIRRKRLMICNHGAECLLIFLFSVAISFAVQIFITGYFAPSMKQVLGNLFLCFITHFLLFCNGIICVYLTSVQLGIKLRVIGVMLGWLPVVNIFFLGKILPVIFREQRLESEKEIINLNRRDKRICATKYPILLVHGFIFRDNKHLNYWGRIPGQLEINGATVYYGQHSSALSVEDSAEELKARIETIANETGCKKLNIIAHSKGGLDCRYAISNCGIADKVASLTTVNTPNKGCPYADRLLRIIPRFIQRYWATAYNTAAHKLGDPAPDFMAGVNSLTESSCNEKFDIDEVFDGIFCQSVGSTLKHPRHAQFPLNIAASIVRHYDGENDGLVPIDSFRWGEKFVLLHSNKNRGISHGDIVDMNRSNLPDFDVREFYVQLVADLKCRGL